jgi:hypothetical protein
MSGRVEVHSGDERDRTPLHSPAPLSHAARPRRSARGHSACGAFAPAAGCAWVARLPSEVFAAVQCSGFRR